MQRYGIENHLRKAHSRERHNHYCPIKGYKSASSDSHGWLQGSEPKSLKQVKKIADYFDVDLDYLCFGIEERKRNFDDFKDDINAGILKVVLRRVKK